MAYDNVNFLVVRERQLSGTISTAAVTSAYLGSTLKTRDKCVVVGVTVQVQSGGSAAGTQTIGVARVDPLGTIISTYQVLSLTSSAGASAAGEVHDISLTTPFTLASFGQAAVVTGNAASVDKCIVLGNIFWRYRLLATAVPDNMNMG